MVEWYGKPWSEVVKNLNSSVYSGLDDDQIQPHRDKYGDNEIKMPRTLGIPLLILKNVKELWVVLLFLSSAILFYLEQIFSASVALMVVFISLICIILNEYKEEKGFKELEKLNLGLARVIRDGRTVKVPSEELVVGDIVIVGKGESVLADLRVVESDELEVNEASVTGEKFKAEKYEQKIEDIQIPLSEMKNILFKSSVVTKGSGTGIVIATGMNTQISNIIKLILDKKVRADDFDKRIHSIINFLSKIILGATILIVGLNAITHSNINKILQSVAIFILNALPQGMFFVIALVSFILLKSMENNSIKFKNLSILERFSSINVICTDKIGGFSKEKMKLVKIYSCGNFLDISGEMLQEGIEESKHQNLYKIMGISLLCNDTKTAIGKVENSKDDLMEVALVKFAVENGLDKRKFDEEHPRQFQIPFDTDRRIMTTVNKTDNEHYRANVKGAVDSLLLRCTHIMKNGVEQEITEEDIEAIKKADMGMSNERLSVIGVAYRSFGYEPTLKENIESNLVFSALIGFENPLREDVEMMSKKSEELNVRPIMITEDNKLTAFAVGEKINMISKLSEILSGVEMDNMKDEEFERIGTKISIFSRINSKHKLKIAKVLKGYGYNIAITGHKLTDLPALKMANIGITTAGSNMVKKVSDMFLSNISMMGILKVLEDSRKIVNSIKKIAVYIVGCSMSFIMFMLICAMFSYDLSLVTQQGIWFNDILVVISSSAIALQYRNEKKSALETEVGKEFVKENLGFSIFTAALIGISAFVIYNMYYTKDARIAGMMAYTVLNCGAVLFSFSFSDTIFFNNIASNLIVFFNLIFQLLLLIFIGNIGFQMLYWKAIIIFVVAWFFICIFRKFNKDDY